MNIELNNIKINIVQFKLNKMNHSPDPATTHTGMLVRGRLGVIAGPKKTLKTDISIDLALSLSHAGLFLGRFNVADPARVGVMSGESGAAAELIEDFTRKE